MARNTIPGTPIPQMAAVQRLTPQALAEAIAADGFDAHEAELAALVAAAGRVAVCDLLGVIALDRREPTVARERALGRLVVAYTLAIERDAARVAQPVGERFTVAA